MTVQDRKFLADRMLGKLAKYLVMLGKNTAYFTGSDPAQLIDLAHMEGRTILTRNRTLIGKSYRGADYLFISDDKLGQQLRQVLNHFGLEIKEPEFFTRCLRCNHELSKISPGDVKHKVPNYVVETQQDFSVCFECKRVYWRGTHHKRMEEMLRKLLAGDDKK